MHSRVHEPRLGRSLATGRWPALLALSEAEGSLAARFRLRYDGARPDLPGARAMSETNFIKFLGTAGARFAVTKQIRASGGVWFCMDGIEFVVDPGPGALVRALASKP